MKDCTDIQKFFSEYIDSRLSEGKKAVVEEHLLACPACKDELSSLRKTVERIGDLPETPAPEDFVLRLNERLKPPSGMKAILHYLAAPFRLKIHYGFATATAVAVAVIFMFEMKQPHKFIPAPGDKLPVAKNMQGAGAQKIQSDGLPENFQMAEPPSAKSTSVSTLSQENMLEEVQKEKKADGKGIKDFEMAPAPAVPMAEEAHQIVVWELKVIKSFQTGVEEKPALSDKEIQQPGLLAGRSRSSGYENELPANLMKNEGADEADDVKHPAVEKDGSIKEIEAWVTQAGGAVVSREEMATPRGEAFISFSIPADRIGELYSKLSGMGHLNVPREEIIKYQQGQFPVNIQINLITERVGDHHE